MASDNKQKHDHLHEALKTIGRVLKHEFEAEEKDVTDHIRQRLDQLEAKAKSKNHE